MNLPAVRGDLFGDSLAVVLSLALLAVAMLGERLFRRPPRV